MSVLGQSAIGLDVSDGTLKAVLLRRDGRRPVLRRTWRAPLPERAGPDALAEAIAGFLARARLPASVRLVLSAPAEDSVTRTFQMPVLDAARSEELVRYELLSELGLPDDDLVIRQIVRRGLGEQPVHVYALRRGRLEALQSALAARGVHPDGWEHPGWAMASMVELELPSARDRVLLGVGRQATDLVLLTETGVWARHLPLGVATLDAEPLAARLRAEVEASVSGLLPPDRPFAAEQFVLLEDGACDARLAGALKKAFGLPVARLDTLQRVRPSWRLAHVDQTSEQALSTTRAFGLALCGLDLARFRCPAAEGHPRREALRLLPAAAVAVALSSATLLGLTWQARARTLALQSVLPISLQGDLQDRARDLDAKRGEIAGVQARADRLLDLARRRPAVLAPRRALAQVSDIAEERQGHALHVERAWLDAGAPGRPAVLALTLHASPGLDASLGERLLRSLRLEFPAVEVRGPEPAPVPELSQWVVEIRLP